ncbi:DUF2290 domain-containing protein [Rhodopseudomonas palustris]|uniref:DUF2290 domain-containing protein n=1 Tax=Rhodopseudomonas palustris TaxID=1076 RepID=UPI0009BA02B0|nr:DUF2290 domain-containing protein [Rhodopseudomonas palustris]QDL98833.1 DUF2290 domain-containing protein [Rhodopseudomonas palustris]
MTPRATASEISAIITKLIETSLSDQQNWPSFINSRGLTEIGIQNNPSLSIGMKNIPYEEIYLTLLADNAFHIKMLDGALLQMCYRFAGDSIHSHRLCMFPAPDLDSFDNQPDLYLQDELYGDIVGRNIVHFPIRFDFCIDEALHVDVKHPKSHLTLGQYPNCRIPLACPLTPARFISFILRNFYHTAFYSTGLETIDCSQSFQETITSNEKLIAHILA